MIYSSHHDIFNQNMVHYNHILATNNQLMVINNQPFTLYSKQHNMKYLI